MFIHLSYHYSSLLCLTVCLILPCPSGYSLQLCNSLRLCFRYSVLKINKFVVNSTVVYCLSMRSPCVSTLSPSRQSPATGRGLSLEDWMRRAKITLRLKCSRYGLPSFGKKDQLAQRLVNHLHRRSSNSITPRSSSSHSQADSAEQTLSRNVTVNCKIVSVLMNTYPMCESEIHQESPDRFGGRDSKMQFLLPENAVRKVSMRT